MRCNARGYYEPRMSILENSCAKCNEFKDHVVGGEYPWLSTCHESQCKKYNPNTPTEEDVVENINEDEDDDLIENESPPEASNVHIDELPLELLSDIFELLDGYSLYCAGNVCTKWRDLIQSTTQKHQKKFERTFDELWPYQFRELYNLMDYQVFSSLLRSINCKQCFLLERYTNDSRMLEFPRLIIRKMRELPSEGIHAIQFRDRLDQAIGRIEGPKDSPYENGIFYLIITFPMHFPYDPPMIRFLTRIFHPAVSCHGHISVDLLDDIGWSPHLRIRSILLSIQSLFTDTDLELCQHTAIGKLWKENKPEYERMARIWTEKYAMQHLIHPTPPLPAPVPVQPAQNNI